MTKKQYNSIDLFKFICAILIIIIHTAPFSSYSEVLNDGFRNIICVIAVPFFFIASGFILFSKMESIDDPLEKKKIIRKHIKRLVIMYCLWSAIYFGFVVYKWSLKGGVTWNLFLEYVRDFFLEGSYQTIWFLPALIVATLLVYLLHKKLSYKQIFFLSFPIYLFTLLGSSYYELATKVPFIKTIFNAYYSVFVTIKNGVLFGLIFVSMGAFIATFKEEKNNSKINLLLLVGFFVLFAVEEYLIAHFEWRRGPGDTTLMLVPLSFFIFLYVKGINLPDSPIWLHLRKLSMLLFLCQRIPLSIIELFLSDTILYTNSLIFFGVVLLSTLGISYLLIWLTPKLKFLKYLY